MSYPLLKRMHQQQIILNAVSPSKESPVNLAAGQSPTNKRRSPLKITPAAGVANLLNRASGFEHKLAAMPEDHCQRGPLKGLIDKLYAEADRLHVAAVLRARAAKAARVTMAPVAEKLSYDLGEAVAGSSARLEVTPTRPPMASAPVPSLPGTKSPPPVTKTPSPRPSVAPPEPTPEKLQFAPPTLAVQEPASAKKPMDGDTDSQ